MRNRQPQISTQITDTDYGHRLWDVRSEQITAADLTQTNGQPQIHRQDMEARE